jgi:hypothetical protein
MSFLTTDNVTDLLESFPNKCVLNDDVFLVLCNLFLNNHQQKLVHSIYYSGMKIMIPHIYELWKKQSTFSSWTIDFFIKIGSNIVFNDLDLFLNKINNIRLNNQQLLILIIRSDLTKDHLKIFDKYGYNWCNENNLIKYVNICICHIHNPIICKKIPDIIQAFSKKNIYININKIIYIITNSNTVDSINLCEKIIESIPHNMYTITNDIFYELFKYYKFSMEHIFIKLFNKCIYTGSIQHLEYLSTLNTVNETMFSYFQTKYNILLNESMFINSIKINNISLIKYFLDNKMEPKQEYIYAIKKCESNSNITLNLLIKYGLVITPQLYVYLKILNYDLSENENNIPASLKEITNMIITQSKTKNINKPKFNEIRNIKDVQKLFKSCTLSEIHNIINKSTKKIDPDITCFKLSLYNPNIEVMLYVFEKYNFVPEIFDIIKMPDLKLRYYVLYKFYPHMVKE